MVDISRLGGRAGATPSSTRPSPDGWRRAPEAVPLARIWEGNVNGFRGRVNLAGPFDPDAPRGTYLDIMV